MLREKLPDGRTAIAVFLERATNLAETLKLEENDLANILIAILNDKFIGTADAWAIVGFPVDNSWRIIWLVTALLKRFDGEQRAGCLKTATVRASGLSAVVNLVAILEGEHDPQARAKTITEPLITEIRCQELIAIASDRIARAAREDELADTPMLARVIWVWRKWKPDDAKAWITQFAAKDQGLLRLIEASTGEGRQSSFTDHVAQSFLSVDIRGLSEWIDLPTFRSRLESLLGGNLTDKQRFGVSEILKFSRPAQRSDRWAELRPRDHEENMTFPAPASVATSTDSTP